MSCLFNSRKTTRNTFSRIRNRFIALLEPDSPSKCEVKFLEHEFKETEIKLEEICERIQTALTSLGDADRIEQLEVWLDKLSEEALKTKTEAAQSLDARIN